MLYCQSLFPIQDKTISVDKSGRIVVEFFNSFITQVFVVDEKIVLGGIVFRISQIIGTTNEIRLVSEYPLLSRIEPMTNNVELSNLFKKISLNCKYTIKDIRLPTFEEYKSATSMLYCNFDSGDYLCEGLYHIFRYNKETMDTEKMFGSIEGFIRPILEIKESLPQWSKVCAFGYCWVAIEENKLLCSTNIASSYYSDNEPSDYMHNVLLNWLTSNEKMRYKISSEFKGA